MLFDEDGKIIEDPDLIKNALSTGMGTFKIVEFGVSFKDPESDIKRQVEDWFFLDDQSLELTDWKNAESSVGGLEVWSKDPTDSSWNCNYLDWFVPGSIERYRIKKASGETDSEIRDRKDMFKQKWKRDYISELQNEKLGTTKVKTSDKDW